ncbi:MAG TPA: response regulator [Vicinamibacterales bacterium]|nr:response regulator [Vicinamibacterales bacterium]
MWLQSVSIRNTELRLTEKPSSARGRDAPHTILVVDDNPDIRHLFSTYLRLAGYSVEAVGDGVAALRRIEEANPDLLVLDLGLPLLRGEDVATELAARAHTREIPVVIVTGEPLAVAPASAACVLLKPVNPTDLLITVKRCLEMPARAAT